jgi:hypothetical protein
MPPGHPYELVLAEAVYRRLHVSGNPAASVWQEERDRDGVVTLGRPTIRIDTALDGALDVDAALELAAALVQAVRLHRTMDPRPDRIEVENAMPARPFWRPREDSNLRPSD